MPERESLIRGQIAERLRADAVLSDFVAPFPNLLGRDPKDLAAGFKRMADLLGKSRRSALIRFTIGEGKAPRSWCLALTPEKCNVSEEKVERTDLEVLTSKKVWSQVASGKLSPLEAFGQGKLRVRGDIGIARLLARRLQSR